MSYHKWQDVSQHGYQHFAGMKPLDLSREK